MPDGDTDLPERPWLSDEPIRLYRKDGEPTEEAFGVEDLITGLARIVETAKPPFTLSLSGTWGIGKSTVAQGVVDCLNKGRRTPAALVDLWTQDLSQLRRTLVVTVGAALTEHDPEKRDTYEQAIAEKLDEQAFTATTKAEPGVASFSVKRMASVIRDNKLTTLVLALVLLLAWLAVNSFKLTDSPSQVATTFFAALLGFVILQSGFLITVSSSSTTRGPSLESVLMNDRFRQYVTGKIEKPIGTAPARMLLVVDNLDRLTGEEAMRALSEIRALVEIPNSRCIFLIPVDRDHLEDHLARALPGDETTDDAKKQASGFLDKFFNVDLRLTAPEPVDIRDWAREQAKVILPTADKDDFNTAVGIVVSSARTSPRKVKRLLNGISTRYRLISPAERPSLAKIAFVETLITEFPMTLDWFSEEPRRLLVAQRGGESKPPKLAGEDLTRYAAFVRGHPEITVSAAEFRVMLALRGNREWKGVSTPGALAEALWSGNRESFDAAFDQTPASEQESALECAVDWVQKSDWLPSDALGGLLVLMGRIERSPVQAIRLRGVARRYVIGMPDIRWQVTTELVRFVFAGDDAGRPQLADAFAEAFKTDYGRVTSDEPLMTALHLGGPLLSAGRLVEVRTELSILSPNAIEVLFRRPVDTLLVEGQVAEQYGMALAQMTLAPGDVSEVLDCARKLADYASDGGTPPPALSTVVTNLTAQLVATPGDIPAKTMEVMRLVPDILRAVTPGPDLDALGSALAARSGMQSGDCLDIAMRLRQSDPNMKQTVAQVDEWLTAGSPTPGQVEPILTTHLNTLSSQVSVWADKLMARWLAEGQQGFAKLVMDHGPRAAQTRLAEALANTTVAAVPARVAELVALYADDKELLELLVTKLAIRANTAPVADVAALGSTLVEIERLDVSALPVVEVIARLAGQAATAEFVSYAGCLRELDAAGLSVARQPIAGLLQRAVAVSATDPVLSSWLANASPSDLRSTAVLVLTQTIEAKSVPAAHVITMAREVHAKFNRSPQIARALIARADQDKGLSVPEVDALLAECLDKWQLPRESDIDSVLTQIANDHPEVTDRIAEVKRRASRSATEER
jgi:hypothetical protein